jgi:hypothetical protein
MWLCLFGGKMMQERSQEGKDELEAGEDVRRCGKMWEDVGGRRKMRDGLGLGVFFGCKGWLPHVEKGREKQDATRGGLMVDSV